MEFVRIDEKSGDVVIFELSDDAKVFEDEVNLIVDEKIKSATIKILNSAFENADVTDDIINHTKKVFKIAREIAKIRGYINLAIDAVSCAALLHDLYKCDGIFHPFMIRVYHKADLDVIDPGFAEQICSLIEGHEGYDSVVPKLAPKDGTFEQILAEANKLSYIFDIA